ncbi:hypothetical protein Tco_1250297 [Tanacetum coccineum]
MERGFLSPREKGGGGGTKEKQSTPADVSAMGSLRVEEMTTSKFSRDTKESGLHAYRYAFATDSGKLNDDGVDLAKHDLNNEAAMDGVVPSANVASGINNGTQDEKNGLKNSATNPNKDTSYANLFTGESRRKSVNFRTLITPAGNRIDVAVPVESIRAISERFVNTAYGFFLGKRVANLVVANYVRNTWGKYDLVKLMLNSSTGLFLFQFSSMDGFDSILENGSWSSFARAMIELRAHVELKDTIVVAMPKLVGGRVLYVYCSC